MMNQTSLNLRRLHSKRRRSRSCSLLFTPAAKAGLRRSRSSFAFERLEAMSSFTFPSMLDIEMKEIAKNTPRCPSPTPTEIIPEEEPHNPDTYATTLAALGIKVSDYATSCHPLRAPETFFVRRALMELAYCVQNTDANRTPMCSKQLHRLIASGFLPEDEAMTRCSPKDMAVLRSYRTSPRVDYPWVVVCPPEVEQARSWTSSQRDTFLLDPEFTFTLPVPPPQIQHITPNDDNMVVDTPASTGSMTATDSKKRKRASSTDGKPQKKKICRRNSRSGTDPHTAKPALTKRSKKAKPVGDSALPRDVANIEVPITPRAVVLTLMAVRARNGVGKLVGPRRQDVWVRSTSPLRNEVLPSWRMAMQEKVLSDDYW